MQIGAQLYTIRDFCQNKADFAESLRKIADIGYKNVQVSGTCAYEPEWLASELKKNGLHCVLTHIAPDKLTADPQQVALDHTVFNCDYIGLGGFGFSEFAQDFEKTLWAFKNRFAPVVNTFRQADKYFMYHNHAHEFQKVGGKTVLAHLADCFPGDVLGFTLDTYWIQTAGGDPAYWIEQLSGRVPCIHLKDHTFDRKMAAVGEGNINFDRIFCSAEDAGTQYMLVEQDDCNGEDPFACLERSYNFLRSRGFE